MENWNPIGWALLFGGFLLGVVAGLLDANGTLWPVSYGLILGGIAILVTNMIRTLWRYGRKRKAQIFK